MATAAEPEPVTLVQLIADPEKYDGKLIRVIGFLSLAIEGTVLYLHREDFEHSLGNGIWVDTTPEIIGLMDILHMYYVLLEGVFDSRNRGHQGTWRGSITNIRRAMTWLAAGESPGSAAARQFDERYPGWLHGSKS